MSLIQGKEFEPRSVLWKQHSNSQVASYNNFFKHILSHYNDDSYKRNPLGNYRILNHSWGNSNTGYSTGWNQKELPELRYKVIWLWHITNKTIRISFKSLVNVHQPLLTQQKAKNGITWLCGSIKQYLNSNTSITS